MMNRELLIQYVDILNKMENIPYDVRMSRNDLDYSIIDFFEKKAANDPELYELLKQIKSLPIDERAAFVKEYLENKSEEKPEPVKSEEEEISKVFGVDVDDIQHLFLANGNEIFYFYESQFGRNVVLENSKKGRSLVEQLKDIQIENDKYQTEDAFDNAHNILADEALRSNMELNFYSKDEIINHEAEMRELSREDADKVKYLLKNYDEFNIKGINIENMIYIDQAGDIFEITYVDNKINIAKPDSQDYSFDNTENDSADSELDDMFDDSEDTKDNDMEDEMTNDEKQVNTQKPKVYVKSDMDSGFTNNAFYFFMACLVIIIIVILIVMFVL